MNNRLQQFLDLENLSPARLADLLGVQRSGVSHILSGRNKPGFDFIQKLLTKFPALSADWFLTGKGKPYKEMNNPLSSPAQNPAQFYGQNYSGRPQNSPQNISSHMRGNFKNGENFQQQKSGNFYENGDQQEKIFGGNRNLEERENSDERDNFNDQEKFLSGREYINSEDFVGNINSNKEIDFYNENSLISKFISNNNLSFEDNSNNIDSGFENNSSLEINSQNETLNNNNSYNKTGTSSENGEFIMNFEALEQESTKSTFLEQNVRIAPKCTYLPDNMNNTAQKEASYRRENQINEANQTQYQKKRSVNRVIVFYSDGSFDEFFPQHRVK